MGNEIEGLENKEEIIEKLGNTSYLLYYNKPLNEIGANDFFEESTIEDKRERNAMEFLLQPAQCISGESVGKGNNFAMEVLKDKKEYTVLVKYIRKENIRKELNIFSVSLWVEKNIDEMKDVMTLFFKEPYSVLRLPEGKYDSGKENYISRHLEFLSLDKTKLRPVEELKLGYTPE